MAEADAKYETGNTYLDDENTEKTFVIRWPPLVSVLEKTADEAYAAYMKLETPSEENIQGCLQDVYRQCLSATTNNTSIPFYATTPPIQNVHIFLFNDHENKMCPCCLPDVFASIEVQNPLGVTKDDILRDVIDYLYNNTTPSIYNSDGSSSIHRGMVVSASDWTWTGSNENGEALAQVQDYGSGYQVVKLVFYCCKVKDYPNAGSKGDC